MHNLCPLCLKRGVEKKMKLMQINFEEAVSVCEEEKCAWPFGYQDFTFHRRQIGKGWSCYWDDYETIGGKRNLNEVTKTYCTATPPLKKDAQETFVTCLYNKYSHDVKAPDSTHQTSYVEHEKTSNKADGALNKENNDDVPEVRGGQETKTDIGRDEKCAINDLPPVNVSVDVSMCKKPARYTISSIKQHTGRTKDITESTFDTSRMITKRNMSSGKQYEKFSFNAIKGKIAMLSSNTTVTTDAYSSLLDTNLANNMKKEDSRANVDSNCGGSSETDIIQASSKPLSSTSNLPKQGSSVSLDALRANVGTNLDAMLEYLMSDSGNTSTDVHDEWINSLLS